MDFKGVNPKDFHSLIKKELKILRESDNQKDGTSFSQKLDNIIKRETEKLLERGENNIRRAFNKAGIEILAPTPDKTPGSAQKTSAPGNTQKIQELLNNAKENMGGEQYEKMCASMKERGVAVTCSP